MESGKCATAFPIISYLITHLLRVILRGRGVIYDLGVSKHFGPKNHTKNLKINKDFELY